MLTGLIGKKIGMTQVTDASRPRSRGHGVDARAMHRLAGEDRGD